MFIDKVEIEVKAGKGGDGMIAFRREKCVPRGGPSGGNGGHGASIILKATSDVNTLINYRFKHIVRGNEGGKGDIKNQYGRNAQDVYLSVPVGTAVYNAFTHELIGDLDVEGETLVVAKGGRGGRGNACFANSRNRAPKVAENGIPGEEKKIILELKLLADVGLVGFPSVGKSTLLSIISDAKPEIADYPFTTLSPNLGVVNCKDGASFVVADLPGLIEGAHLGKGLGLEFLRHIERCRVVVHMVDMSGKRNPYDDYLKIRDELKLYGSNLNKRKEIIVATKMDEEGAEERLSLFKSHLKNKTVIAISALTNEGVEKLIDKIQEILAKTPKFPLLEGKEGEKVYEVKREDSELTIEKVKTNTWRISGDKVEKTYKLINISTDEGLLKLINYLRRIGVDQKLQSVGAKDGDTVLLCDYEFEYVE